LHNIDGKAIAFYEAFQPSFKTYAENIVKNAKVFSEAFIKKGVEVVSGGTDNHLLLINVKSSYNITGKEAENFLEKINITINKNSIPFDELPPLVTFEIMIWTEV
ncbi:serine hydroxymethyltransferase, partial [Mycoplasmopsis synoviae]